MDLFSSNVLTGVVSSLQTPPQFLVTTFFPGMQTETSEEIHFDVEDDVMGLAPFVSPVVEGKIMTTQGFTTKTFKPAYVKPKTPFDPSRALKRTMGEALTGNLSPDNRMRALVSQTLENHRKLIDRRLEWMAAQVLRSGSVTITGDLYPTTVVNFNRDAALTVVKGGGTKWGDAGVKPLEDLQTWGELILQKSGSSAMNVVMDIGAWKKFKSDAEVLQRLDSNRASTAPPSLRQDAMLRYGGALMGEVDAFNIWVYSGQYKDDAGAVQQMLPNGTVIMVGDMMGTKAFGAILDHDAGMQALPYFSKSWVVEDPSRRFVMTQSAPLLVPYRPNASLAATVL